MSPLYTPSRNIVVVAPESLSFKSPQSWTGFWGVLLGVSLVNCMIVSRSGVGQIKLLLQERRCVDYFTRLAWWWRHPPHRTSLDYAVPNTKRSIRSTIGLVKDFAATTLVRFGYLERPLRPGHTRLRWHCVSLFRIFSKSKITRMVH
jgi:hypothetical protein